MRRCFLFLVAMSVVCHPRAGAAQASDATALTPPDADGPTEVSIDIQFDLISIDERTETFEVDVRLWASWQDDRWAYDPDPDAEGFEAHRFLGEAATELLKTRLWWPYFEITDARSPRQQMSLAVEIDPYGEIHYTERFTVVIQQGFDLSDFPWDAHEVEFSVESFILDRDEMVFVPDNDLDQWTWDIQEWDVEDPILTVDDAEDDGFSTATSSLIITRKSSHYVTKIILPLILIISIGSAVFWMNLDTMHLGDRLSVSLTSLLTVVAFDFVTSDGLPKLGYSTSLDVILILAYVFSAVAILENVRAARLHAAGKAEQAVRLDRIFRFAYPPAFLLAVASIWLSST